MKTKKQTSKNKLLVVLTSCILTFDLFVLVLNLVTKRQDEWVQLRPKYVLIL